jgi:hypothetical protein
VIQNDIADVITNYFMVEYVVASSTRLIIKAFVRGVS